MEAVTLRTRLVAMGYRVIVHRDGTVTVAHEHSDRLFYVGQIRKDVSELCPGAKFQISAEYRMHGGQTRSIVRVALSGASPAGGPREASVAGAAA